MTKPNEQTEQTEGTSAQEQVDEQESGPEGASGSSGQTRSESDRADKSSRADSESTGRDSAALNAASESGGLRVGAADGEERAPLFAGEDAKSFRQRWEGLQASFVDQPREAVQQADELVGDLMKQLTSGFSEKRSHLEAQWEQGDEVSTEELRVALTRYRSFFNRLLAA